MMVSQVSSPRKSLYLPRQQKVAAYDGKSDGKAPYRLQPIPLATLAQAAC
jgi:hypothetical protein